MERLSADMTVGEGRSTRLTSYSTTRLSLWVGPQVYPSEASRSGQLPCCFAPSELLELLFV
jgi:hypothetical protein